MRDRDAALALAIVLGLTAACGLAGLAGAIGFDLIVGVLG